MLNSLHRNYILLSFFTQKSRDANGTLDFLTAEKDTDQKNVLTAQEILCVNEKLGIIWTSFSFLQLLFINAIHFTGNY